MKNSTKSYKYDVGLSFAGRNRATAKKLRSILRSKGISVFYDEDEQAKLWGKNLYQYFQEVYQHRCLYY